MKENARIDKIKENYYTLLDPVKGEKLILDKISRLETRKNYLDDWLSFSKVGESVYPSQGLLTTPYDYLNFDSPHMLPYETIIKTLRVRRFFLELFNHPYRIFYLDQINSQKFVAPPKIKITPLDNALKDGLSLSVGDFGASVVGSENERISRRERYAQGPFVKLGKQARSLFVGSSSPDVWNSAAAISTMASCHCLAAIPRNGIMNDPARQSDLAKEVFEWLDKADDEILSGRSDRKKILKYWKGNVMGTLEASVDKAIKRTATLYKSGVRVFRIYSPEPGTGCTDTLKALRKTYGNKIEIFTSFIIDINQAKKAEKEGSDGVFVGIGGGGRCITGIRSGSAIDWPMLVYKLRGEINIPVVIEGGASDHIAITLLLGGSGISLSRIASGGTLESPGGALFYSDSKGKLFKPYGGEASARTKFLDGKLMPFTVPSFVEGETGRAYLNYGKHKFPSLTYNIHTLTEDTVLSLVFRGADSIPALHAIDPSPLGRITSSGDYQRNTH